MISFVNAKINIRLQVVARRDDGYHDLQTVFYPVGFHAGTPATPESFCDILEVTAGEGNPGTLEFTQFGRPLDCPPEKNLAWRAARLYLDSVPPRTRAYTVALAKHLPDQAGMGGGSADAAFTLLALAAVDMAARLPGTPSVEELSEMALKLGADCPFFILNRAAYASGVGEKLEPICLDLSGMWLAVVKPALSVSTRDAFAGIKPKPAAFDLRELPGLPLPMWEGTVCNDFETTLFPKYPLLGSIKEDLYAGGAAYASLTGSGSCVYGIFESRSRAAGALERFRGMPTINAVYLLKM